MQKVFLFLKSFLGSLSFLYQKLILKKKELQHFARKEDLSHRSSIINEAETSKKAQSHISLLGKYESSIKNSFSSVAPWKGLKKRIGHSFHVPTLYLQTWSIHLFLPIFWQQLFFWVNKCCIKKNTSIHWTDSFFSLNAVRVPQGVQPLHSLTSHQELAQEPQVQSPLHIHLQCLSEDVANMLRSLLRGCAT